jgi:hypothetical protein
VKSADAERGTFRPVHASILPPMAKKILARVLVITAKILAQVLVIDP